MWPSEEWASKTYDWANIGLIASLVAGVISTFLVVWMGNVKEGYLKQSLAQSKQQTATLELQAAGLIKAAEDEKSARVELESRVAWRRLRAEEQPKFCVPLKPFGGQTALIAYNPNDLEAFTFALTIASALRMANWDVTEPLAVLEMREGPVPLGTNPPLQTGVIVGSTNDEGSQKAARALIATLHSYGFDASKASEGGLLNIHPTPDRVSIAVEYKPEGPQGEYKLRKLNNKK